VINEQLHVRIEKRLIHERPPSLVRPRTPAFGRFREGEGASGAEKQLAASLGISFDSQPEAGGAVAGGPRRHQDTQSADYRPIEIENEWFFDKTFSTDKEVAARSDLMSRVTLTRLQRAGPPS
jgi:hypothetical protein